MSRESALWLNTKVLIGYSDQHPAWHRDRALIASLGLEDNHYPAAVPVADVLRRLFTEPAVEFPVMVDTPNGPLPVDGYKAVGRASDHHVFAVHSDGYRIHQYPEWLLDNIQTVLGTDLHIGSAGLLRDGAQAWVSLEMAETFSGVEGVQFRPQLLMATSHDGSLASTSKQVVTVTVCDNTLNMALSERGSEYRVRHTRRSEFNANRAAETLGLVEAIGKQFAADIERYVHTYVPERSFDRFMESYVPVPAETGRAKTIAENKVAKLRDLYNTDARVSPWRGTQFGVLQMVNTYNHWEGTTRGETHRNERNMSNAIRGVTGQADQRAMSLLADVLA